MRITLTAFSSDSLKIKRIVLHSLFIRYLKPRQLAINWFKKSTKKKLVFINRVKQKKTVYSRRSQQTFSELKRSTLEYSGYFF